MTRNADDVVRQKASLASEGRARALLGERLGANRVMYAEVEDDDDGSSALAVIEQGYASGVPPYGPVQDVRLRPDSDHWARRRPSRRNRRNGRPHPDR